MIDVKGSRSAHVSGFSVCGWVLAGQELWELDGPGFQSLGLGLASRFLFD